MSSSLTVPPPPLTAPLLQFPQQPRDTMATLGRGSFSAFCSDSDESIESRNPCLDLDKPMGGSSFGDHSSERRDDDSKEPKNAKIWRKSLFRKPKNEFSLPHGHERVENYNTNSPQSRSAKKKFDRNMRTQNDAESCVTKKIAEAA